MKKLYFLLGAVSLMLSASAGEITDVINATTVAIPETYTEQEASFNSEAVYLLTLKDDGSGPQFKAGSSGIVSKASGGLLKRVEVSWGSKSNEDILIYGQSTPYASSCGVIEGTLLGTIEFSAGTTTGIDVEGEWEYIGITTTAKKGKAAQFGSISITWEAPETRPDEPCNGIIINEVCGDDGTTDGHEDWIELFNPTTETLDLSGVRVQKTDEDGIPSDLCVIADGVLLASGEYYVVEKGTHFTAGLSNNKNLTITLYSPLDFRLSMFDKVSAFTHNGSHRVGGSYSLLPDGAWAITDVATKGAGNTITSELVDMSKWYAPVTDPSKLTDGMEVLLVNTENGFVMSYDWDTTKDGGVYLYGYKAILGQNDDKLLIDSYNSRLAVVKLVDGGDGTWAIKFGDTNNYLNEAKFLACTSFKSMDFKKKDDPSKGTRATITFNAGGDAEINYGDGGVIKFNYKGDDNSRFFNYDPADKPEEHLAVYLYVYDSEAAIGTIKTSATETAPVYYNMQGIRVEHPTQGLYIRTTGNKSEKIYINK